MASVSTFLAQLPLDNVNASGSSTSRFTSVYAVNGVLQTADSTQVSNPAACTLGLTFVNALLPKSWTWSSGPDTTTPHYGFLVQDIQSVLANAFNSLAFGGIHAANPVTYNSVNAATGATAVVQTQPGVASLCYAELMAPVVLAIQQLSATVTSLQTAVTTLQTEVAGLLKVAPVGASV